MLKIKQQIKDMKVFVEIGWGVIERFIELAGSKSNDLCLDKDN